MTLLTQDQLASLPKLYETENVQLEDKIAQFKLFLPASSWIWYVIEWDGEDTCFGYVIGLESEFGYFTLSELRDLEQYKLRVELDESFVPTSMKEILEGATI